MSYPHHIAAIDIGSKKIAALIAQVSPNADLTQPVRIIGAAKTESRGIKKALIINIDEAVSSILKTVEAAERMAGFSLKSVLINISGSHINSLNSKGVVAVTQPDVEITEGDVVRVIDAARAVSLPTNQQILHVWPRFFTIDSQEGIKDPVGMSGVRLEVDTHIITAASTTIKNLTKSINDVGLDVDQIVFSGLASSLAVVSPTEKELGVVMADIGADVTDITVYTEGALSYSTVIPIGGHHVTKDLAAGLRINLEEAEKLKIFLSQQYASTWSKEKRIKLDQDIDVSSLNIPNLKKISYKSVVNGIIHPRLEELFTLIYERVKEAGFANEVSGGLVTTGGGSLTIELDRLGKRITGWSIKPAHPTNITGLIDDVKQPEFSTAAGLIHFALTNQIVQTPSEPLLSFNRIMPLNLNLNKTSKKIIDLLKSLLP
ncbi:MAG: cell division protein FtsA [bacterium]|nr:cell division protein FtsA [bacterium]